MLSILKKRALTTRDYLILILLVVSTIILTIVSFTITYGQGITSNGLIFSVFMSYTVLKVTSYVLFILSSLYGLYLVYVFDLRKNSKEFIEENIESLDMKNVVVEPIEHTKTIPPYNEDMVISFETYDFYNKIISFKSKVKYTSDQSVKDNPGYFLEVNSQDKNMYRYIYATDVLPKTSKENYYWVKIEEKEEKVISYENAIRYNPGVYISTMPGYYLEITDKFESANRICYCTSKLPPTSRKKHAWVFVENPDKEAK
jgi:hypothetical protein